MDDMHPIHPDPLRRTSRSAALHGRGRAGSLRAVENGGHPKASAQGIAEIQDAIYRDRILRARAMTPGERCSDVIDLSHFQFEMMHAGAMKKLGTDDPDRGWEEVRRGLERLARAQEAGLYTTGPTGEA